MSREGNFIILFFYQNEYYGDFNNPIYDEVNVNWYCPPTYNVYFDDDDIINNNSNCSYNIIDVLFIDNLKVECKKNMEDA